MVVLVLRNVAYSVKLCIGARQGIAAALSHESLFKTEPESPVDATHLHGNTSSASYRSLPASQSHQMTLLSTPPPRELSGAHQSGRVAEEPRHQHLRRKVGGAVRRRRVRRECLRREAGSHKLRGSR